MKLRCSLLSLLRTHHPDCEHCVARKKYGIEMRKRLEELGWWAQVNSQEIVAVCDSDPSEVITLPVSLRRGRSAPKVAPITLATFYIPVIVTG